MIESMIRMIGGHKVCYYRSENMLLGLTIFKSILRWVRLFLTRTNWPGLPVALLSDRWKN